MRFRLVANVLALAACLPVLAQAQNPASAAAVPREGTWELSVGAGATYLDQQLSSLVQFTSSGPALTINGTDGIDPTNVSEVS